MEQLMNHPWLNMGTMPMHPRGLKVKITNDDVNPAAVFYMVNYLNTPESQIRESVINFKPNATTGTYFLLCQRLNKGYGLPDGVDFVTEELTLDTGPQRTHRGRPQSAHHHNNRQRDNSLTRASRDSSIGVRNERDGSFHGRTGYTPPEKIQRPMISVKVPYGDGIVTNGYDQMPEGQKYNHEQYTANGGIQREKAGRNISSSGSNRELSVDTHLEHVYPLASGTHEDKENNKRTSLPDLPKESGSTPRNRLKDIFKLSAKLRKPKSKKGILKPQDKSQSVPDHLNQGMKPPVQLHDALAIRNVRFQRNRDPKEEESQSSSRRPDYYQPQRLAIIEPLPDNRDIFSPRNDGGRSLSHGRDVVKAATIHHHGEYRPPSSTPPSSANEILPVVSTGRKYGYIKPPDAPKSKYTAQQERANLAWNARIGERSATMSDLSSNRSTSMHSSSNSHKMPSQGNTSSKLVCIVVSTNDTRNFQELNICTNFLFQYLKLICPL